MANITDKEKELLDQLYVYAQNIREYKRGNDATKDYVSISIYFSEKDEKFDVINVYAAELEDCYTNRIVYKRDDLLKGCAVYEENRYDRPV